jgi:MFS family permease
VLWPLGLGTALSLMGDATMYTVLPTHTEQAGIALGSVGIMLGANRAIRIFLNGPAGLAYDRWPRRRLFVPALFIGALSTVIYALSRGFWPLLFGRLLWGLAWSGIWVGGATMILDVTTLQDRGRWTGLYQTWFFLGAAGGSFAGGLLTDKVGYAAAMWIGAALTALGGLIALLLLPETRPFVPGLQGRGSREMQERGVDNSVPWRDNGGVWVAAALYGTNRFVISGIFAATLGLLVQERAQSMRLVLGVATLTGLLSASRTLFSMLSAPLSGTMSDWLESRWKVALWGLAMAVASMLLMSWDRLIVILVGIALGALASGSIQTLVTALIGDLVKDRQRGRAIGLLHTAGDLGSAAGPLVAYASLPWLGLPWIYRCCAGLFGIMWLLVMWFQIRQRER